MSDSKVVLIPFMLVAAKTVGLFWWYLSNKSDGWKILQGELFIKTNLQQEFLIKGIALD